VNVFLMLCRGGRWGVQEVGRVIIVYQLPTPRVGRLILCESVSKNKLCVLSGFISVVAGQSV
jgi:hypothetical protein